MRRIKLAASSKAKKIASSSDGTPSDDNVPISEVIKKRQSRRLIKAIDRKKGSGLADQGSEEEEVGSSSAELDRAIDQYTEPSPDRISANVARDVTADLSISPEATSPKAGDLNLADNPV